MTTCLGKSCSLWLLCVCFVNFYQCMYVCIYPFGFEGGMYNVIVLIPAYCLFIYFIRVIQEILHMPSQFAYLLS